VFVINIRTAPKYCLLQQKIKQKNHSTQIPGTATFLNR
jgi:hypothetical protein